MPVARLEENVLRFLGRPDAGPDEAQPPYSVRCRDFLFVAAQFGPEAVRAALPPQLDPSGSNSGFIVMYSAPIGWGLAPYTCCFVALEVLGYDSPDGSRGYFMAEGFYSGRAARIMHDNYNTRLVEGSATIQHEGDLWNGEARRGDSPAISISLRLLDDPPMITSGIHHYLGENTRGINIYSVAFTGDSRQCELQSCEILPTASPLLQSLRPTELVAAFLLHEVPLAFSPPRLITAPAEQRAADSAQVALLDLLGRLGLPAALVTDKGRPIFANREAEALIGSEGGLIAGRSRQRLLEAVADAAELDGGALPEPVAIEDGRREHSVLVQALPVSAAIAGERAVLLLFADPLSPAPAPVASMLELLGLTPAEARLAALIGAGCSPKEAASALAVTENTARSTLQVIYSKLGIGRQSELARIVARLESFAAAKGSATAAARRQGVE